MEIDDRTNTIKFYSKNIVDNFFRIGIQLKAIRDKELYKEKYETFTEYIENSDFTFKKRFVYQLFQILDDPKLKVQASALGVSRTIELLNVQDREEREELAEKAIKEDMTTREIRAEGKKIHPERAPLIDTEEEWYFKLRREYNVLSAQIRATLELYDTYTVWQEKNEKHGLKLANERNSLERLWNAVKDKLEGK